MIRYKVQWSIGSKLVDLGLLQPFDCNVVIVLFHSIFRFGNSYKKLRRYSYRIGTCFMIISCLISLLIFFMMVHLMFSLSFYAAIVFFLTGWDLGKTRHNFELLQSIWAYRQTKRSTERFKPKLSSKFT